MLHFILFTYSSCWYSAAHICVGCRYRPRGKHAPVPADRWIIFRSHRRYLFFTLSLLPHTTTTTTPPLLDGSILSFLFLFFPASFRPDSLFIIIPLCVSVSQVLPGPTCPDTPLFSCPLQHALSMDPNEQMKKCVGQTEREGGGD